MQRGNGILNDELYAGRLAAEFAKTAPTTEAVALHPAILARYEEQLTRLQAASAGGIRDGDRLPSIPPTKFIGLYAFDGVPAQP